MPGIRRDNLSARPGGSLSLVMSRGQVTRRRIIELSIRVRSAVSLRTFSAGKIRLHLEEKSAIQR